MPLNASDVSTLSRLLDEAMELPSAEVEPWLLTLGQEHAALLPQLRRMLADRTGQTDFLASVPSLGERDESVAREGDGVGPYRLIREIGQGGMGAVWLAERTDGRLGRKVALKLPRLAWGAGLVERMTRERDIAALLEHPNIARLYDAGVDDRGRPFLAFEFIDGVSLDQWCRERRPPVLERLRLFIQIGRAVAYAHGRLVVHRDLKPSNVLVSSDGQAHLLDFGIAKLLDDSARGSNLTQEQGRVLTLHYASPEQIEGKAITVASDVYSLGVLLFELLTAQRPYDGEPSTRGAVEQAILRGEPRLASSAAPDKATARALRGELDAIIAKALRREPADRYATADGYADDVARYLNGERVLAQPDSLAYRLRKAARRHWLGMTATACVLLAIVGGATATVIQAQRAMKAAERERIVKDFVTDVFRADGRTHHGAAKSSPVGFVEGGAQLIETRFKDQPDLQAELYGVVSVVFLDMGASSLAADYASRQLVSLKVAKSDDAERRLVSLRLARALFEDERLAEAEQVVRPWVASQGKLRLSDDAPILLARILYATAKTAERDVLLRRIDQAIADAKGAPSTAKAWSQAIHAQISAEADLAGSVIRFEEAIETALRAEGSHSMTAVEIRLRAASTLFRNADADASEPFFDAAVAELSGRGGAFANRAALERADYRWARARLEKGSRTLALRVIEQSRDELLHSPVATPRYIFAKLDYWSAGLKSFYGDLSAVPLLEQAVAVLNNTHQSPGKRYDLAMDLGWELSFVGRHDDAAQWLDEALALAQTIVGRRHPDVSWVYIPIASNQLMAGRTAVALATLDEADRELSDDGEPRFVAFARDALAGTRAAALLQQGHAAMALDALAPRIHEDSRSDDIWRQNVDLLYMGEPYGEALCALRRFDEGLRHLNAAIRHREKSEYEPYAPELARVRAVAGACALGAGRVEEARRLADLSRAAFTTQSNVSDYFKAPLAELEARLKKRG